MNESLRRDIRGALVLLVACALLAWLSTTAALGVEDVDRTRGAGKSSSTTGKPAWAVAASLPTVGGAWTELTDLPYDLEDPDHANYEDFPYGSGYGLAGGRVQALAVDGDTVYAGAASGGVWRSLDRGKTWAPITDDLPSLSSGDLAIDPSSGDVWYATGEAAGYSKIYRGVGVFRSTDGGDTWELIGRDDLDQTLIGRLEFDGAGNVYAATSHGLYRRSTSAPSSEPWTLVLRPGTPGPYGFTFANDVVVRPGTAGRFVVASFGWREGEVDHNGFYVSRAFGLEGTWERLALRGELDREEIGRASLAYSSDGTRLYALVQSWRYFIEGRPSFLYGVFMSPKGDPRGPWRKIAGTRRLTNAEGALAAINPNVGVGSHNGVQAIAVDPSDPDHVYVGLVELFETTDAGRSWSAAGPASCGVGTLDLCRNTTHGDHHALAFSEGIVYSGNDGGVYRRPVTRHTVGGWINLNRNLHALQYYAAGVGNDGAGDVFWGGIQDNGVSLLRPGASTMVAAHCCEAFSLIVAPSNPDRAALVHVDNAVMITTNGGLTRGFRGAGPPDPVQSFFGSANVLRADPLQPNRHWALGGGYVWETTRGWRTTRSDWTRVDDPGRDRMVSAVDVSGDTIYAGWCGPISCDPDAEFVSGIDTNVGGEWHRVVGPSIVNGGDALPNRWISSIRIDPGDPFHVYAVYGEYRRPWTAEPRPDGHVFETIDGGESWTDISGNMPGAPATDLLIVGEKLVVSMDVGVFVADAANPTFWSKLGSGIPNVAVNSLTLTPDGGSIVAATYGRGLWSIEAP
jgi:hypothetical protein